jgi:hypothetical protein
MCSYLVISTQKLMIRYMNPPTLPRPLAAPRIGPRPSPRAGDKMKMGQLLKATTTSVIPLGSPPRPAVGRFFKKKHQTWGDAKDHTSASTQRASRGAPCFPRPILLLLNAIKQRLGHLQVFYLEKPRVRVSRL